MATVDTLGEALALAGVGLVLAPLALLLARAYAAMHTGLAARILSAQKEASDEG